MSQSKSNTAVLVQIIRSANLIPKCRCGESRDDHKPLAFKEKLYRGRPVAKEWGECLDDDCDCVGYSPDVN